MGAANLAFIKKWRETYKNVAQINKERASFRIVDIAEPENLNSLVEIQLLGKNICFKYTRQEILADTNLYNNLSENDQKLISTPIPSEKNSQKKIEVLAFKKANIDNISIESDIQTKLYTVTVQYKNEKQTHHLTAKEILQDKSIFNALSNEEKIEIAFNAGVEDILEEQQQIKNLTAV